MKDIAMMTRLRCWIVLLIVSVGIVGLSAATVWAEDTGGAPGEAQPAPGEAQPAPTDQIKPADPVSEPPATAEPPVEGAEATDKDPTTQTDDDDKSVPPKSPARPWLMPLAIGGVILVWVFMGRKGKKSEKQRKEMLANLKKGDKVTSIGGIVGTVLTVRERDVTVKIDEGSNTKMRFARWAIRTVGTPDDEEAEAGNR